ncbi:MAG: hypothetical protein KAR38_01625 [Calditrichia bacterium]|nr:hypothetical protein [Calditrichia bacterium]
MSKIDDFIQQKAAIIKNDKTNSASYLADLTIDFINEFLNNDEFYQNRTELLQGLSKFSNAVCKAKSLMGSIYNHNQTILNFIEDLPKHERNIDEIKKIVIEETNRIKEKTKFSKNKIRSLGSKLIINHNNIFTLSYSGFVKETLFAAKNMKKRFVVKIIKSGPKNEGIKLAEELAENKIKNLIYSDSNIVSAVTSSTFVLLGCDRITETTFINKIGSYAAAIIAKNFDIPVYILADTSKVLLKRQYLMRFDDEDPKEIYKGPNENVNVHNQYFEEVPLDYVSKIVTEVGIFETEEFIKRFLN